MKSLKKALCAFLAVIMVLTAAPLGEFAGLDFSNLFATEANAAVVSSSTKIGTLQDYDTIIEVILNGGGSYEYVSKVTIDGKTYSITDKDLLDEDKAESYLNGKVIFTEENNIVVSISKFYTKNTEVKITGNKTSITYKDGWFSKKKFSLTGNIFNSLTRADSYNSEIISNYYNANGINQLDNIYITLKSPNKDILYFDKGIFYGKESEMTFPLGRTIGAGSYDSFDCDIYVNRDYYPPSGSEDITIECILNGYLNGVEVSGVYSSFIVNITNEDYEEPEPVWRTMSLLDLLVDMQNKVNQCSELTSTQRNSLWWRIQSAKAIKSFQNINMGLDVLDVYEFNCYFFNADYSVVEHAGEMFLEAIVEKAINKEKDLDALLDDMYKDYLNCKEFNIFINWYYSEKGYQNSNYNKYKSHCPTDVFVKDDDGVLVLSIIDNEIVCYDEKVTAFVTEGKKTFYLPTDIEHNIEIIATDDGTMDYSVSAYTPSGLERTIEYNDVPLVKDESYTATAPCETMLPADTFNLISESGEEIVCDSDSLPPVEDNIVDVIVAEELFDGFPVEIIDLVADTMFNMKSVVDLSAYDISTDDAVALFSAVAKYYPAEYSLIANSDFTYKIIVSPSLDRIMNIRFYYGDDANLSTYQKRVKDLNAEIDALVAKVEGMDDFEKALYIHDYIVLNSEYDLELLDYMEKNNFILPGELRSEKYTEYSILVNGTGVCGSYALAYRAVLNAAGMECLYLSSSQMNHAWNLVKIDGNWYHVDCCWDDPIPDTYGRARRTYFLRTDSEIMNLNHYAWSPGQYKATSEKYSDMPRGYDIQQKYDNGKWYYVKGTTLYSSDEYGKNATEITSISASSIDVDDNSVYFSTGRYIYEYDLETSEKNLVYMLSNKDSGEKISDAYLSNIYVDDENVEYYKSIYKDDKRTTLFDTDTLQREKFASITGIEISQTEATLDVFETMQLIANIITTGSADDLEVEWISSDESVAKVDSHGNITAANIGVVTITVKLFNFIASCDVIVTGDGLSGMCGENATWEINTETKTLTISGAGEITERPWKYEKFCYVEIGSDITAFSSYIFNNVVEKFNVDKNNLYLSTDEYGVLFNKQQTELIKFPQKNQLSFYEIPSTVIKICSDAFFGCEYLKNVTIPRSVTSIASDAFESCFSLEHILIPDSVIDYNVNFANCSSLKTVQIDCVVNLLFGGMKFRDCPNLNKVEINKNKNPEIYVDEYGVFYNADMTQMLYYPVYVKNKYYIIPESVTSIGMWAGSPSDSNNHLMYLIIPESVKIADGICFAQFTALQKILIKSKDCSLRLALAFNVFGSTPTIYGYSESTAEEYSSGDDILYSGNKFIAIDVEPHIHDYFLMGYEETTAASDGYEYYECYCGEDSYTVTLHNYGVAVDIKPTCTIAGVKKEVCINCDEENIIEFYPATGEHNYQYFSTTPGDCITAPVMNYKCTDCNSTMTKIGKIDDGHKYVEVVVAPTCTEKGYTTATCEVCLETVIYDFKSPVGHDLTIKKSDSYCSAHDAIEYSCKKCTYSEVVAADENNLVTETVIIDPTCTKSGIKSEICTLCGATVSTEIISPLSHEYAEDFTIDLEATCTTAGRKSQHCIRCDEKRAVTTIDPLGHSEEILPAVAATCTETGLTEGKKCSVCGKVTVEQTITEKLNHKEVTVNHHKATATEDGYTGDIVCEDCGEIITVGTVIPATGTEDTNCNHVCHKSGFMGFLWKIVRFLYKIFGINKTCDCGVAHY